GVGVVGGSVIDADETEFDLKGTDKGYVWVASLPRCGHGFPSAPSRPLRPVHREVDPQEVEAQDGRSARRNVAMLRTAGSSSGRWSPGWSCGVASRASRRRAGRLE